MSIERKVNCWEVMKCGREKGGEQTDEHGVCPVTTEIRVNGINGGENAGRICWTVAGTYCSGEIQGTFAAKLYTCQRCDFYQQVKKEEGAQSMKINDALRRLKKAIDPIESPKPSYDK